MINRIATILFLVLLVFTGFYVYQNELAPCRKPLAYDIGGFDGRFSITKDRFLATIIEAEKVWEKDAGRDLFSHQPGAKFKINLIFDERQERTIEADRSKEEIEGTRTEYDTLLAEYKSLATTYERDLDRYNSDVSFFESRLSAYNSAVAEANSRGGATPKAYKELDEERKRLEEAKAILDRQRLSLNGRASELNYVGDRVNYMAKQLNITVDVHNQRFGEAREFDQGDYRGNSINIYQFDTVGDLRLVLAHELGHSLGIDHVENPTSVMYYLMGEQDIQNPALSRDDIAALRDRCNF